MFSTGPEDPDLDLRRAGEALQYGRERANGSVERLLDPWIVRSPDRRGALVVKSDFITLAHMGWSAQRDGRLLTARELDEETFVLRALRETLHVEGVVASSAIGLVERVELLNGTIPLQPISFYVKLERTESDEDWRFDAYFPMKGLAPASKVRLRIQGSGGKEMVIPVDLSKIR